ncbi:MAG TPA: hypothetical protein EYO59_11415, partial [Chromatiaceae bacterium]|nr:hypothetical protein [Chromatiaceae bacterium]
MVNIIPAETGPPEWFDRKISKVLPLPNNNNFVKVSCNVNFGLENHNDELCETYQFTEKNDKIDKLNFAPIVKENYILDQKEKLQKQKEKLINSAKEKKKTDSTIKAINTKFEKKIKNIDKTTVARKIRIYPNDEQKQIINTWSNDCQQIYNKCVDMNNNNNNYFNKGFMATKKDIFNLVFKNNDMICPYDMATHEVQLFCANLKSSFSNLKNKNINHFTMKYK